MTLRLISVYTGPFGGNYLPENLKYVYKNINGKVIKDIIDLKLCKMKCMFIIIKAVNIIFAL